MEEILVKSDIGANVTLVDPSLYEYRHRRRLCRLSSSVGRLEEETRRRAGSSQRHLLPVGPGNNLVQYPGAYGDDLDQMIYSAIETNAHVNVFAYVKTHSTEMRSGHLAWRLVSQ